MYDLFDLYDLGKVDLNHTWNHKICPCPCSPTRL